uniref:Uncharacterized protein n=1 Tax=Rhizophora mucronata TaxID=61149 RepID=A0A2P2P5C7_RHIMU
MQATMSCYAYSVLITSWEPSNLVIKQSQSTLLLEGHESKLQFMIKRKH